MFRTLRLALVAVIIATAGGCVERPTGNFSSKLLDVAPSEMGLIVGSFGPRRSERRYLAFALAVRHIATKEIALVRFYTPHENYYSPGRRPVPNFQDAESHGTNVAMQVPAGQYEIFNIALLELKAPDRGIWLFVKPDFSVPFTVAAGQATYIGHYLVIGLTEPATAENGFRSCLSLAFSDQRARDIAFARKKWPDFDFTSIINGTPDLTKPNPLSAVRCASQTALNTPLSEQ